MINVTYPLQNFSSELDDHIDSLAEEHGFERDSSGAGFGERDMQYDGPQDKETPELLAKFRALDPSIKVEFFIQGPEAPLDDET